MLNSLSVPQWIAVLYIGFSLFMVLYKANPIPYCFVLGELILLVMVLFPDKLYWLSLVDWGEFVVFYVIYQMAGIVLCLPALFFIAYITGVTLKQLSKMPFRNYHPFFKIVIIATLFLPFIVSLVVAVR